MSRSRGSVASFAVTVGLSCLAVAPRAFGQTNHIGAVDAGRIAQLSGNVHFSARPGNDAGLADPGRVLNHISINFKPDPAQQADLDKLLADQQDPSSPIFHVWLTPEQFGDRFGLSSDDLARVVAWLDNAGFHVTGSAAARNWVAFDGTVDAVQRAFHTEIHNYRVDGETHFANSTEPSVPAAIAPLVSAIMGLNDFRMKPARRRVQPAYTTSGGAHYLAPDDYATIYDIKPLYAAGYDGTGQKLVILGRSDITVSDIAAFRSEFGLPANTPEQILVGSNHPAADPDAESEADLDLEWSGAIARNATIIYVYAPNVLDAAKYALSPPAGTPLSAPVVSYSFGECEAFAGSQELQWQAWINQANAQGVTFIASSGDSGAAGCDPHDTTSLAEYGLAVELPAASPGVTAVGGTRFNEGTGNYWSATNSATTGASALSYIPETAWNDLVPGSLASSGGGMSIYFSRPSWQAGFSGVLAGTTRVVPDVALAASGALGGHDGYFTVSNCGAGGSATLCSSGGTSAAAPSFAGMIAILNQYATAKGSPTGQGNINPALYKLFTTTPNAFHDITSGNNIVPCVVGTTDCTSGSYGYNAGPGYDPVTGLGSVDAYNLITQWFTKSITPSTTSVTAAPATFTLSSSTVLTAKVSGTGGTPTGSVSFAIPGKTLGTVTLASGAASIFVSGAQFVIGSNTVTAVYSGDSNFSGSSSIATLTVNLPTNASAVVPVVNPNPVPELTPNANGSTWFFRVTLTETAGTATTLTGLSVGGVNYSAQIVSFFGTAKIGAKGAISASLSGSGYAPPSIVPFVFSGVDASGQQWTQTTSATLLGRQSAAALSLTSAPSIVYQNTAAASNCQWEQNMEVQELNGFGVTLTRFLANGADLSTQIGAYFGATQLNALGSLQAGVCWSGISPPETLSYEVDGIDSKGNTVTSSATVQFEGAPSAVSSLSLSATTEAFQLSSSASQTQPATIAVNVPAGIQWSASAFPANQTTSWLTVVPSAGVGPANVTVTAGGSGQSNGIYKATLTFQAPQAVPSFVSVPITMTIGGSPVTINHGGIVPVYSTSTTIQPGSWVSMYGSNLAASTVAWNGNFPTSLGGTTVTVNGKPAYLWFVSPGQINFQAPADTASGTVTVVVANSMGIASSTVTLSQQSPAFLLLADGKHATGLIIDPNGGGSQAGGFYDLLGPTGSGAGFRPAKAGEPVVVYGVGFGPTNPTVPAGQTYNCPSTGCAQLVTNPQITVGGVPVPLSFAGVVEAGLYQFNFNLPTGLSSGDQILQAVVNGVNTPVNVFIPVQ